MPMKPGPGPADFGLLRRQGGFYIDKTPLIATLLTRPEQVVLFPRPRRFGKTLNLSTIAAFLDVTRRDGPDLFSGLAVTRAGDDVAAHRGRYPVLSLTLKDVKAPTFDGCLSGIRRKIAECLESHRYLLHSDALDDEERALLRALLHARADRTDTAFSLQMATRWLERHWGELSVVLIDEYDAVIEAGWLGGFYDEVTDFLRQLFGAALKDNPRLFKGVLTGVRRVAKESLFSDLNNIIVYSLLDPPFEAAFGFTEDEVAATLDAAGLADRLPEARDWYNGYLFGGRVIYNPWSVLNFAATGALEEYWASPGSEGLIRRLMLDGPDYSESYQALIGGAALVLRVDKHVALRDLDTTPETVWSLLVMAGYLTAEDIGQRPEWRVRIPNREVQRVWTGVFRHWLERGLGRQTRVDALTAAVLSGDEATFGETLGELVRNVLSTMETGPAATERVYHLFTLGLLAWLEPDFRVRSERETGRGRSDALITPTRPGLPGAALEFKRARPDEPPEDALDAAAAQIIARDYAAELRAAGASPVHLWAVAFRGKDVWVRRI